MTKQTNIALALMLTAIYGTACISAAAGDQGEKEFYTRHLRKREYGRAD